jgi:hypothetical protein
LGNKGTDSAKRLNPVEPKFTQSPVSSGVKLGNQTALEAGQGPGQGGPHRSQDRKASTAPLLEAHGQVVGTSFLSSARSQSRDECGVPTKRRTTMSNRWKSDGVSPGVLEAEAIQRGIDATIRAIAADRYNPTTALPRAQTVTVVGAPKVVDGDRGWVAPEPLASPPGQETIRAMCDAALPHGRVARMRAQFAKLSPEQQATLLRGMDAEPGGAALRAMLEAAP